MPEPDYLTNAQGTEYITNKVFSTDNYNRLPLQKLALYIVTAGNMGTQERKTDFSYLLTTVQSII